MIMDLLALLGRGFTVGYKVHLKPRPKYRGG